MLPGKETFRKDKDCYFYYYSTCNKGSACPFRHEPAAQGIEDVCNDWLMSRCNNPHCPLRHLSTKKTRKAIPCYWENQVGGCKKPFCPFKHEKKKTDSPSIPDQPSSSDNGMM